MRVALRTAVRAHVVLLRPRHICHPSASSAEAQAALEEERAQRAQEAKEHAAAIRSLEETNRDLMLFLESRDKIGSSDAAGGAMLGVAEAPEPEIAPNDRAAVVRARLQKKQKERRGR